MNALIIFFKNWKNVVYLALGLLAAWLLWSFRSLIVSWLTPSDKSRQNSVMSSIPQEDRAKLARFALRYANALGTNKDSPFWQSWTEDDEEVYKITKDVASESLNFDGISIAYQKIYTENRGLMSDIQSLTDEPYLTKTNDLLDAAGFRAKRVTSASTFKIPKNTALSSVVTAVKTARAVESSTLE